MTCIVGIQHNKQVWIGGDSGALNLGTYARYSRKEPKVFTNGPMIFGYTTSFRMGQLLKYSLVVPPQKKQQTDMGFLVTTFVDSVREVFKSKGWGKKEDGGNGCEEGGEFLFGYKGKLYKCESDFQIAESTTGQDACGCGQDFAMGSLYSTKGDPKTRILVALRAAVALSAGVCAPFHIVKLG